MRLRFCAQSKKSQGLLLRLSVVLLCTTGLVLVWNSLFLLFVVDSEQSSILVFHPIPTIIDLTQTLYVEQSTSSVENLQLLSLLVPTVLSDSLPEETDPPISSNKLSNSSSERSVRMASNALSYLHLPLLVV